MLRRSIYVAGHRGLVGSSVVRNLKRHGYAEIITRTRQELDLRDRDAVYRFLKSARPELVLVAAAKVGGIKANNDFPVEFLLENLQIQNNLISGSFEHGVQKLLFLGSSCIYPKFAPQPIKETALLTGPLEPTNEPYAIAKIAGIKLCQAYARQYGANYVSAMPTNLYGPGDKFDPVTSHVIPALIQRMHQAKKSRSPEVVIWGTGTPRREFLHCDDLAQAVRFLFEKYDSPEIINIGWGEDITIQELAMLIRKVVGFEGELVFDQTKPDGTPQKLLDVARLRSLGWEPEIPLEQGIEHTYRWFVEECDS
jgi:GDP-L-fucose synthase